MLNVKQTYLQKPIDSVAGDAYSSSQAETHQRTTEQDEMRVQISYHVIEIQDSGAPRGERNIWRVTLNGVVIYDDYNGKKAERLFDSVCEGLRTEFVET